MGQRWLHCDLINSSCESGKSFRPKLLLDVAVLYTQLPTISNSQFGSHLMKGSQCLEAINDFPSINHDQTWSNVSLVWRMQVRVFYRRQPRAHTKRRERETDEREEAESAMPPYLNWLVDTIWRLYTTRLSFDRKELALNLRSIYCTYRQERSKWDDDYMERWRQTKEGESKIKSTYSIRLFFEVMGSSSHLLCPRIVYVRVSVSSAYLARERIPHHTLTQSHPCRLVR